MKGDNLLIIQNHLLAKTLCPRPGSCRDHSFTSRSHQMNAIVFRQSKILEVEVITFDEVGENITGCNISS